MEKVESKFVGLDKLQIGVYLAISLLFFVGYVNDKLNILEDLVVFQNKYLTLHNTLSTSSILFPLLLLSTLCKAFTKTHTFFWWRYLSLLSFSLLGSVAVYLFTADTFSPIAAALVGFLVHVGFWTWNRELEQNESFNNSLSEANTTMRQQVNSLNNSLTKVQNIISLMPHENALKEMSEAYESISVSGFALLNVKQQMKAFSANDYKQFVNEGAPEKLVKKVESSINSMLKNICSIAEVWTTENASSFEANIMLAKDTKAIDWQSDDALAFKRGSIFFPYGCYQHTLTSIFSDVLVVQTSIGFSSAKEDMTLNPLMLPATGYQEAFLVPGAPEAYVNKLPVQVDDVTEIASKVDVSKEKQQQIAEYFESQRGCGSVLSLPIPTSKHSSHSNQYCGVLNIYRPERNGVKSKTLFRYMCTPLLHELGNLLYLREQFMNINRGETV